MPKKPSKNRNRKKKPTLPTTAKLAPAAKTAATVARATKSAIKKAKTAPAAAKRAMTKFKAEAKAAGHFAESAAHTATKVIATTAGVVAGLVVSISQTEAPSGTETNPTSTAATKRGNTKKLLPQRAQRTQREIKNRSTTDRSD
jgi:hypothetical protein